MKSILFTARLLLLGIFAVSLFNFSTCKKDEDPEPTPDDDAAMVTLIISESHT